MGMYTALSLGVELEQGVDDNVVDILNFMVNGSTDEQMPPGLYHVTAAQQHAPPPVPDHAFFRCDRWTMLLRCNSYYFDWQTNWELFCDELYGPDKLKYYLTGVSNLKNYDGEIRKFMEWLNPYIDTHGYLGWTMYEEDQLPTLIYRNVENERSTIHYIDVQDKLARLNLLRDYI